MEKIFVMIKPWSIQHREDIFSELDKVGKRLETIEVDSIPRAAITTQHSKYQEESFFQLLIDDLIGKPSVIILYKGNQDEFNKQKTILRKRFGRDITPQPPLQRNALHISSSRQEFERDYNAWEEYLNGKYV